MLYTTLRATIYLTCLLLPAFVSAQTISGKLASAYKAFVQDPQLQSSLTSLYVVDAETGEVVYDQNSRVGMVPASTLKIVTSASAYALLGQNFRYKTSFAYQPNNPQTPLLVLPSGDPTFGSQRWDMYKADAAIGRLAQAIKKAGIKAVGAVLVDNSGWDAEAIPDGWIWQDIGNYYGAGAAKLNWRENQFDVLLKSGSKIGDPVTIVATEPALSGYSLQSALTSAAAGTGDNAYIYFPLRGNIGTIRGTIPVNQSRFSISGALPSPADQFAGTLQHALAQAGIKAPDNAQHITEPQLRQGGFTTFHTETSPSLDSIIYWFNRKSINLYGEALAKTIAFKNTGTGTTEKGVEEMQKYWKGKGIPETELNIVDGSGLSPLDRVTTHAQVSVLQQARKQPWFDGFYAALPVYNGMKLKSGTLHGVKGFCGYHQAKDGKTYIVSFLVNNYNGSQTSLIRKMYTVLNVLK